MKQKLGMGIGGAGIGFFLGSILIGFMGQDLIGFAKVGFVIMIILFILAVVTFFFIDNEVEV